MPVTNVQTDPKAMTMTITAEFDAPIERVWQMWENPRQLEQWWGPPTYPATFVDHDFTPGGTVTYFMTGPEGDQPRGWWRVIAVDAPRRLEFEDGFADGDGSPNLEMPTTKTRVELTEPSEASTRMVIATNFSSIESMEQMVAMGMEEGMTLAVGQIDNLLRVSI